MQDWVLKRLAEFVGRTDRKKLGPHTRNRLVGQSMGDHRSYRVERKATCLGKGLVVTEAGVIPDYPGIRRVYHLTNAITKYYYSPFFLETQVPGYHTRVAWLGGREVAFTRDGRYCAFSSDRASDFIPRGFFEAHPNLIVCLAISGDDIPYATSQCNGNRVEIDAWGTEVLQYGVREPLATHERYELFDEFEIKNVPHIGPLDSGDISTVIEWMRALDESGAKGAILKPSEPHHRPLKYGLPSAQFNELLTLLELGKDETDLCHARLFQACCGANELELGVNSWDWEEVGRSLLAGLASGVDRIAKGNTLATEHSVWLSNKESAECLLAQLGEQATDTSIELVSLVPEDTGWRLRFRRQFIKTTAAMRRRMSGISYRD